MSLPHQNPSNIQTGDFSHLDAKIIGMFGWRDNDRIKSIKKDRWFSYSAAEQIEAELDAMLEVDDRLRLPGMVITANPNNGKSSLVRHFAKRYPAKEREDGTGVNIPVLLIDGPPRADVKWLLGEILIALNAPYKEKEDDKHQFRQIVGIFKRLNVRMLIIDEISDIVSGTASKQRDFLSLIKQTATRAGIRIILSGTPPILSAISVDDQAKSRFVHRELPDWTTNLEFINLLATFEKHTPLKLPSKLAAVENRNLAAKIQDKSRGRIGWIFEILEKSAEQAINTGEERITENIVDSIII